MAELFLEAGDIDDAVKSARGALRFAVAMPAIHLECESRILLARALTRIIRESGEKCQQFTPETRETAGHVR
jgi:hypothetical protein